MKLRIRGWTVVRLVLSLLLLWLAVRSIEWRSLLEAHEDFQADLLIPALLLIVTGNLLAASRWAWIARSGGLTLAWRRFVGLYFAGGLINQGLPSTLGGDSYRAILSTRGQQINDSPALRYGFLYVALDRGLGLVTNLLIGAAGLILGGVLLVPWWPRLGWIAVLLIGCALFVATLLITLLPHTRFMSRLLEAVRLPHAMPAIRTALAMPYVFLQLVLGILVHLFALSGFLLCLKAFGASVPFEAIMIGMAALALLMMLPISISGWGLRETTLSSVLLVWGVPASVTVLAAISYGLLVLLCFLPAVWFLIKNRITSTKPES